MIPSSTIANMYVKIIGENSLLSMAQNNLLANLERIAKVRTYTFLENNAQTEFGVSRNFGHERYYCWEDTTIDCRHSPGLVDSDVLDDVPEVIGDNKRFQAFKKDIEERSGGILLVDPFVSVLRGEDNMRYNIRRSRKVEDFDIIRVGFCLSAGNDEDFDQGMQNIEDVNNPLKIKPPLSRA